MPLSHFRAIITFKSAAHALMGEEAIAAAGLRVGVMGRPVELGADCGFCLRVGEDDLERALDVLTESGLSWQGAYHDNAGKTPRFEPAALAGERPLGRLENGPENSGVENGGGSPESGGGNREGERGAESANSGARPASTEPESGV